MKGGCIFWDAFAFAGLLVLDIVHIQNGYGYCGYLCIKLRVCFSSVSLLKYPPGWYLFGVSITVLFPEIWPAQV